MSNPQNSFFTPKSITTRKTRGNEKQLSKRNRTKTHHHQRHTLDTNEASTTTSTLLTRDRERKDQKKKPTCCYKKAALVKTEPSPHPTNFGYCVWGHKREEIGRVRILAFRTHCSCTFSPTICSITSTTTLPPPLILVCLFASPEQFFQTCVFLPSKKGCVRARKGTNNINA